MRELGVAVVVVHDQVRRLGVPVLTQVGGRVAEQAAPAHVLHVHVHLVQVAALRPVGLRRLPAELDVLDLVDVLEDSVDGPDVVGHAVAQGRGQRRRVRGRVHPVDAEVRGAQWRVVLRDGVRGLPVLLLAGDGPQQDAPTELAVAAVQVGKAGGEVPKRHRRLHAASGMALHRGLGLLQNGVGRRRRGGGRRGECTQTGEQSPPEQGRSRGASA